MGYNTVTRDQACPECTVIQQVQFRVHTMGGRQVIEKECPVCGHVFGGDDDE